MLIIAVFLVGTACQDELFQDITPETDKAVLELMGEAYEMAETYQDSIEYFTDVVPDPTKLKTFEDLYHTQVVINDANHQIYSHMNANDDHHHTPNPPAHKHHNDPLNNPFGDHHDEGEDHNDDGHGHEDEHESMRMNPVSTPWRII